MAEITVHSPISKWLTRIESSRSQLIDAARSGNRVAGAFAMADARVDLIESLADENVRARLLRMTSPEIAMVELANDPQRRRRFGESGRQTCIQQFDWRYMVQQLEAIYRERVRP